MGAALKHIRSLLTGLLALAALLLWLGLVWPTHAEVFVERSGHFALEVRSSSAAVGDVNGAVRSDLVVSPFPDIAVAGLYAARALPTGPISDPEGDTMGTGPVQLDISSIDAVFGSSLTITAEFFTPIAPPWDAAANSVFGLISLDTDQDASTGFEFCVILDGSAAPGFVDVVDDCATSSVIGSAPVAFTATSFATTIPLSLVADDGLLDYFVAAGTADEVTDDAPNDALATSRPLDMDGDGVPDSSDNCPAWANPDQSIPPWSIPVGDADCDGFTADDEISVGTDPNLACGLAAWPPDFNDDTLVNIVDIVLMKTNFGAASPDPLYDPRWDVNANGMISISDVLRIKPFFNQGCG